MNEEFAALKALLDECGQSQVYEQSKCFSDPNSINIIEQVREILP
jgi:hypothetical protein